jgi:hypothetical protein
VLLEWRLRRVLPERRVLHQWSLRQRLLERPPVRPLPARRRFALALSYTAVLIVCVTATPGAASPALQDTPAPSARAPQAPPGWEVASSEHFEILYRREQANRLSDVMREAEQAYMHIAGALKYDLTERVSLIFVAGDADVQDTLALVASGGPSGRRIVVSVESLDGRPGVLIHELTHQFAFEIIPDASHQSPWLIEGLADHQRGIWDTGSVRRVREALAGAWVPDLDALRRQALRRAMTSRASRPGTGARPVRGVSCSGPSAGS